MNFQNQFLNYSLVLLNFSLNIIKNFKKIQNFKFLAKFNPKFSVKSVKFENHFSGQGCKKKLKLWKKQSCKKKQSYKKGKVVKKTKLQKQNKVVNSR